MKINLNDITTNNEERIELDLNSFFGVGELKIEEQNEKRNIDTFTFNLRKKVFLNKKPIVRLNINKINVETIKINKNLQKDIDLLNKKIKKDRFTLVFDELKEGKKSRKEYFDLFIKREYNLKYFKRLLKITGEKIDGFIIGIPKIYYVIILSSLIFISFLLVYRFILENTLKGGYEKINNLIVEKQKIEQLDSNIKKISMKFDISFFLFKPINFINKYIKSSKINNAGKLIDGGRNLSNILINSLNLKNKITKFIGKKDIGDIYFTNLLENIKAEEFLKNVSFNLEESLVKYSEVEINDLGGLEIRKQFLSAVGKILYFKKQINILIENYDELLLLLGHEKEKKYLIVFQNNDEIRPTGGFMGSMGIIKIFRGKIEKFEKKDVYAYEWEINKKSFRELAPKGLNKITKTFGLRDANYFVDIAKSSEKIKYFIKQAGEDINGIIYVNQNTLLDLLNVIKGVQFEKIKRHIDSENFSEIMSLLVEAKKFKIGAQGTPKQILFDFMKVFTKKIKDLGEYEKYLGVIIRNFKNRDLMFYSFDKNNILSNLNLNGNINFEETLDFNYPIFTSISGNKSDRYIKRTYKKYYEIQNNCRIFTKFEINLEHTFIAKKRIEMKKLFKEFGIDKLPNYRNLLNIQGNGLNHSYVRLLIPKDAILNTKIHNVQFFKDKPYKIIDFFLKTQVGGKSHRYIEYILKNPDCKKYSYKVYKQPGIREYNLEFFNTNFNEEIYEDWKYIE